MLDFHFKVNPPAREISHCSTVLNGIATRYRVDSYRTTLCVKAVQCGSALYLTPKAKHLVTEDSILILNEGQVYSLDFRGPGPHGDVVSVFSARLCRARDTIAYLRLQASNWTNSMRRDAALGFTSAFTRATAEWEFSSSNFILALRLVMRPAFGWKIAFTNLRPLLCS